MDLNILLLKGGQKRHYQLSYISVRLNNKTTRDTPGLQCGCVECVCVCMCVCARMCIVAGIGQWPGKHICEKHQA